MDAAVTGGPVAYAVPGSPTVAERTVALLAERPTGALGPGGRGRATRRSPSWTWPSPGSAWTRWTSGVRIVDAERFAVDAAGERGPLLVAQCWSRDVLSDVKLSVDAPPDVPVTVLHHLGLPDEQVLEVRWEDLDRSVAPDHLTSLWVPRMGAAIKSISVPSTRNRRQCRFRPKRR